MPTMLRSSVGACESLAGARRWRPARLAAPDERACALPLVLGTHLGDKAAWTKSDLAHPPASAPGYGVAPGTPISRLLLGALPVLMAETVCRRRGRGRPCADGPAARVGDKKAEQLRRLLDPRNVDAAGLMFQNRWRSATQAVSRSKVRVLFLPSPNQPC
jgi:hypothetical protein